MSKTFKNERTRAYLDELAKQRKERQARREQKSSVLDDIQEMLFTQNVIAQDY
jgi:polyhydroxyalkanoate synthesis regulator phasin